MSSNNLSAYHNDHAIKAKYIDRLKVHMAADELVQGVGWDDIRHRGCAIGCTLDAYDHTRFPIELGMPSGLAHLCDALHENTSDDVWPTLQLRILEAIPLGFSNWGAVLKDVIIKSLEITRPYADETGRAAIDLVAACWRGERTNRSDWNDAKTTAWYAVENSSWGPTEAATWAAAEAAEAFLETTETFTRPWTSSRAAEAVAEAVESSNRAAPPNSPSSADIIAEELLESIKKHSK